MFLPGLFYLRLRAALSELLPRSLPILVLDLLPLIEAAQVCGHHHSAAFMAAQAHAAAAGQLTALAGLRAGA